MPIVIRVIGILVGMVGLGQTVLAQQPKIYDRVPVEVDPRAHYIIYLHGRIIEDQGRQPTHPIWGRYEYQKILEALAADGATVISEQRPPNTDMNQFARHVGDQVAQLLRADVRPEQISIVGFSKGGGIATQAAALLENPRINFVFLAACGDGNYRGINLRVWGRILSIYEASDESGRSCGELFAKAGATGTRSEIRINVGEQHGTFFRPHDEWLRPLHQWINRIQ